MSRRVAFTDNWREQPFTQRAGFLVIDADTEVSLTFVLHETDPLPSSWWCPGHHPALPESLAETLWARSLGPASAAKKMRRTRTVVATDQA